MQAERADQELERLWLREMPTGVYDPKFLSCRTSDGPVRALAFTLSRRSPNFTGPMTEDAMVAILRHASGRYGRTLDYLIDTATCLHANGIRDHSIEKLVLLAKRHGLHRDHAAARLSDQTCPADSPLPQRQGNGTAGA
ncbi:MAG: gamma-glutamylcyclotransferase [Ideonella sp.]